MQAITIVCVPGSHVIGAPRDTVITRGVPNTLDISLVGKDGEPIDTTAVATWEFGITRGFLGAQSLLAGVSGIIGNGTGPVITIDTHTEEMAAYLAGKYSAVGYATLKGYDSTGAVKMSYTFPVTLQNVGYDDTVADTAALSGLTYTKGVIDAKFANIADTVAGDPAFAALLDAKEPTANKTQEIDAVTPSADKYTSEAAVVAYVEGAVTDALGDIEAALDELIGGTP